MLYNTSRYKTCNYFNNFNVFNSLILLQLMLLAAEIMKISRAMLKIVAHSIR